MNPAKYLLLLTAFGWLMGGGWALIAAEPRVIGTIENFDAAVSGPFQKGFIESYRWTEEFRQRGT